MEASDRRQLTLQSRVTTISWEELQKVNDSLFLSYTECIRSEVQHFQHLLWHRSVSISHSKGYDHRESSFLSLDRLLFIPAIGVQLMLLLCFHEHLKILACMSTCRGEGLVEYGKCYLKLYRTTFYCNRRVSKCAQIIR
jgi:hypothetical protein